MPKRITSEVIYLRHEYTQDERLSMGEELASSYNQIKTLEEEEASVKAQFKERKTAIEAKQGSLSRNYSNGWEMRNIDCELVYDHPNVGEVTYRRKDSKQDVKSRPMTEHERQMELALDEENPVVAIPPEKSAANITEFFGDRASDEPQPVGAVVEGEAATEVAVDPNDVYPPLPSEDNDDEEEETDEDEDEETEEDDPEYDPAANSVVEMPSPTQSASGKSGPKELAEFHEGELVKGKKGGKGKKK